MSLVAGLTFTNAVAAAGLHGRLWVGGGGQGLQYALVACFPHKGSPELAGELCLGEQAPGPGCGCCAVLCIWGTTTYSAFHLLAGLYQSFEVGLCTNGVAEAGEGGWLAGSGNRCFVAAPASGCVLTAMASCQLCMIVCTCINHCVVHLLAVCLKQRSDASAMCHNTV